VTRVILLIALDLDPRFFMRFCASQLLIQSMNLLLIPWGSNAIDDLSINRKELLIEPSSSNSIHGSWLNPIGVTNPSC
jgi:hypothetical protein